MNKIKNSCFDDFINNISANDDEIRRIQSSHNNVRDILDQSELNVQIFKKVLVGSYSRSTNIKTLVDDDKKIDVDLAVIFNKNSYNKPQSILDKLYNLLNSTNEYKGKLVRQKRSIGIELSKTHLDVVPFQCVNNENDIPLYISKQNKQEWELTDPIGHKEHYKKVKENKPLFVEYVKAIKWWKKINKKNGSKYPIGIAIEELVSIYYASDENKFTGLIKTMKGISTHKNNYLQDPRNKDNNFFSNMNDQQYNDFISIFSSSISDIEKGLEYQNIDIIRNQFGFDFPKCQIYTEKDSEYIKQKTSGLSNYSSRK